MTQRVRTGDGKVAEQRAAGDWTYHAAHQHSHYARFVDFELYRILDPTGPVMDRQSARHLDPSMSGHKSGWHPVDQRMADWHRTDQAPANQILLQCFANGEECIAQGQGWGDHYRWQRPGNYVEFPTKADGSNVEGDYVVQMVVDRNDRVLESNDADNSAYAWIRVGSGSEKVVICERGLGDSPWDPDKHIHAPSPWLPTPGTTADSASEKCKRPTTLRLTDAPASANRGMKLRREGLVRVRGYGRRAGVRGLVGERRLGRPSLGRWALYEPDLCLWAPLRLVRMRCERESLGVVSPLLLFHHRRQEERVW